MLRYKCQLGQLLPFVLSEENYQNIFLRTDVTHVFITRSYLFFLDASANEVKTFRIIRQYGFNRQTLYIFDF